MSSNTNVVASTADTTDIPTNSGSNATVQLVATSLPASDPFDASLLPPTSVDVDNPVVSDLDSHQVPKPTGQDVKLSWLALTGIGS